MDSNHEPDHERLDLIKEEHTRFAADWLVSHNIILAMNSKVWLPHMGDLLMSIE